jgi:ATP-binding cassette subfamily F protein 3
MAMAAIDAPHILILDEPTNHLDIESREALVHALNAYEGTVILVSHDSHLVEMIADQLWIVQDGKVASFDGDMADYQRQLLARRGASGARSQRDGDDQTATSNDQARGGSGEKTVGKSQSSGRVRRQNTSQLRATIKQCEKLMMTLATEKDGIVAEMAKPSFYDGDNADAIARLSSRLAKIDKSLAEAEQAWLTAEESLAKDEANG